jgi:hypothetical protein
MKELFYPLYSRLEAKEIWYIISTAKKKKNTIVIAAVVIAFLTLTAPLLLLLLSQSAQAIIAGPPALMARTWAPVVVTGENIYVAWWTNNTANNNEEVMFRASNDRGQTFGDKINLSNTTDADSWRVEIAAEDENVAVSWWETNQTSDTPVARISTDGGQTFGPMLRLGSNGTISSTSATGTNDTTTAFTE